ncbi:low-specificity L-threonine aldolase [Alkalihalobacterium chitinilyticum]|uniref:Low-specificity L-threonine aldolase n=1 Tax=Alkalihalobacterium chitinilyticum TaxID=2980103 RepID=A0ABT5VGH3_9BACI|nr:low-specificity L-threonine aldolase [Alkalihalobacterium chitinilyticum]MDE5414559.1 low-specificity L-threonine aldolase [Alkalihalobacterium chitinilyticum]
MTFIDFRSDTVTKPTEEMRQAMLTAEVGDDVYGEDPTINRLEALAAKILGKEAALFVTSGTQGNQVAVLTHCRPGDEVILEAESHIFLYEGGASSALAGVQTRPIQGLRGALDPLDVKKAIRGEDIHYPYSGLICLENTHNKAGGKVVPVQTMKEIYEIAREKDVPVHLDGARLFNAAVALGVPVSELTQHVDTVQVCLSKGLSAPVGSILAGSQSFINEARKWRKRLGGGLRQAGVIAAPGIIALEKMIDRLAEDHANAQLLAEGLSTIPQLQVRVEEVETNIILCNIKETGLSNDQFLSKLKDAGILAVPFDDGIIRFVTHREVTNDMVQTAVETISGIL